MAEPSASGRFGEFGGRFVPETLVPACEELEAASWKRGLTQRSAASSITCFGTYAGRPSIITECTNLGNQLGIRLLLKREDLNHTGSHKINNVLGQALLAKRMGKTVLSPRPAPASTVWRPRRPRRCWAWSARSTWAL